MNSAKTDKKKKPAKKGKPARMSSSTPAPKHVGVSRVAKASVTQPQPPLSPESPDRVKKLQDEMSQLRRTVVSPVVHPFGSHASCEYG